MPGEESDGDAELMRSVHAVCEYTRLNIREVLDLPCDLFMLCYKNWIVDRLSLTEEGREYLEECRIARQTEPDWDALHRLMDDLK